MLSAALCASALTWLVFRATRDVPRRTRIRALLGDWETLVDLAVPVDADRDHFRGPPRAPVTVVEYGDSSVRTAAGPSPSCASCWPTSGTFISLAHLPLSDVHPNAEVAAEASGRPPRRAPSGRCTTNCSTPGRAAAAHLHHYAERLGLDLERFDDDCAATSSRAPGGGGRLLGRTSAASPERPPLRQRPPPRRRLRHRIADRRRARRPGALRNRSEWMIDSTAACDWGRAWPSRSRTRRLNSPSAIQPTEDAEVRMPCASSRAWGVRGINHLACRDN